MWWPLVHWWGFRYCMRVPGMPTGEQEACMCIGVIQRGAYPQGAGTRRHMLGGVNQVAVS